MTTDIRGSFVDAARCYAELVDRIAATPWERPGLGEWDLRSLVGHTSRSLITVIDYLRRPAALEEVPSAAAYYDVVQRLTAAGPAAVTERGRQAGLELGADPAAAVRALVNDAMAALDGVEGDPVIHTICGGMRVSNYLPTRTFELAVHTLDIAAACGVTVTLPQNALTDSLELAAAIAQRRGQGATVLLAVTGRQSLPSGFSVV